MTGEGESGYQLTRARGRSSSGLLPSSRRSVRAEPSARPNPAARGSTRSRTSHPYECELRRAIEAQPRGEIGAVLGLGSPPHWRAVSRGCDEGAQAGGGIRGTVDASPQPSPECPRIGAPPALLVTLKSSLFSATPERQPSGIGEAIEPGSDGMKDRQLFIPRAQAERRSDTWRRRASAVRW